MSATIEIDQLRVGMFVHLDLRWWQHPFALSSFQISSPDQIETIRGLGLQRLRWSPAKTMAEPAAAQASKGQPAAKLGPEFTVTTTAAGAPAPAEPATHPSTAASANDESALSPAEAAQAQHRQALAEQRAADRLCEAQYAEAGTAWRDATAALRQSPEVSREATVGLTRSLLSKMMVDGEMCVRVLSEAAGERSAAHALNVCVIALLMGRSFGLTEAELTDMGVGALLHDIGKLDLPERVRHPQAHFTAAEHSQYRDHVAHGVAQGRRMGLSAGALLVIAQHHEMADHSGFPQQLGLDRMSAAARIVALVNRYDNLCNPASNGHALTPHEALSLIFAQARNKFDASMLNAFIRMMGVYPPGSVVQLTDDRYASVVSVNSSRPLKPRVLVADLEVPLAQSLLVNLDAHQNLGIRRSLQPKQLPPAVLAYLAPRPRVVYFFEPASLASHAMAAEMAA